MRITKEAATQVALKLTEKLKAKADEEYLKFREAVTTAYENSIPKAIQEIYVAHPAYFDVAQTVYLDGHGFSRQGVSTTRPVISTRSHYATNLNMTAKLGESLTKLDRAAQKAKEKYKAVFRETEAALVSLRTTNNIAKQFPEAAPYLPTGTTMALVVNLDKLRKTLNTEAA